MVFSARKIILFLLLSITVVSAQSQSAVEKSVPSTISGKVTVGGKAISGLAVVLVITDEYRSNLRPTRFRSTTDEDGNYRITKVPPGSYEVIAASPAHVASDRKLLIIGKNETVENVDIKLQRGGAITGKVTDDEGRPVIEEAVHISATTPAQRPYFRNIRTDDRGIYRAYGVPAGQYTVSAGRDPNSSFALHPPDGEYQRRFHPSAIDPAAAFVIEVSEGSEAANVDIKLGGPLRTYSARGRIIDGDTGRPMPNTRVGLQLRWQHGTSAVGGVAESNKDGEFKVEKLAPGKYEVYSEPSADSDWNSEAVKFEVTGADVEGLLIKTFKGASVSGVVILEGTDDPKVRANLLAARIVGRMDGYLGRSDPSATINPNGSFRLSGLAAGRLIPHLEPYQPFQVIRLERGGMVYPRGVEIKEHEQVTDLRVVVGLANGSIRGVIRPPTGSELPANARLRVLARRIDDPGPYGVEVEADARGHFRVESLIPGTYEIAVSVLMNTQPTQPSSKQTIVVTNGAVADVTIALKMPKPSPQ